MGLFTGLITLPLAPVRGVAWVAQQVTDEAERQMAEEPQLRRQLLQLELDHDAGIVDDEEYERMTDALAEQLARAGNGRAAAGDPEPTNEVTDG